MAKLLKKSEPNMSTASKKIKRQNVNYILAFTILLIAMVSHTDPVSSNPKSDGKWIIVLDAGHGGSDPGAVGNVSKEKNITLAVTLLTGSYLEEYLDNVEVIYTRDDDSSVDLLERPRIANQNNADLFISIHANSIGDNRLKNQVSGTETYIMGLAKDQASLEVAMRENQVITLEEDYSTKYAGFDPQSPESYIIFTLTHNLYQQQSTNLASMVQEQFRERVGRKDRGVKQAGYWVLFNTTMPSILVEIGFICNPSEERFMNSREGQEYLASAIFRACRDYILAIDSRSSISLSPSTSSSPNSHKEEVKFMVQIATTANKVAINPSNFKGYEDVTEIAESDRFKYAIGNFNSYYDAAMFRKEIESDYPDAFVISIINNTIVPLDQVID